MTSRTAARRTAPFDGISSHGNKLIGPRATTLAGDEEFGEFRRKGARSAGIRLIAGVDLVAVVAGVGDHAARLAKEALDLPPLLVGVDAAADAADLDRLVDDGAVDQPFDLHLVRPARGEGGETFPAFGAPGGLHRDDRS